MDYKEKFQLAKDWYTDCTTTQEEKELLERLLPELKESEDERIRKNMREFLLDAPSQDIVNHHLDLEETLAWLEKQGEQKPAEKKEQRDLLFQKMKEAGYEWDAEKKELKKIESKLACSEENSCYYDDICEILINLINSSTSNVNKDVVQKDLDWLMSIKESQSKTIWREEDDNGYRE